jgi:tRNA1(Val) A37 N6-methylase TrmN6
VTRLANVEKAGYFPIPPAVTELILSYMAAPHGGRILDPCAGEGTALVSLAGRLNLEPFGVELHEGRAQAARQLVRELMAQRGEERADSAVRVVNDSYQSLITSRDGYNLLYLNPPYDHDDEDGRLEYQWLWSGLCPGIC